LKKSLNGQALQRLCIIAHSSLSGFFIQVWLLFVTVFLLTIYFPFFDAAVFTSFLAAGGADLARFFLVTFLGVSKALASTFLGSAGALATSASDLFSLTF